MKRSSEALQELVWARPTESKGEYHPSIYYPAYKSGNRESRSGRCTVHYLGSEAWSSLPAQNIMSWQAGELQGFANTKNRAVQSALLQLQSINISRRGKLKRIGGGALHKDEVSDSQSGAHSALSKAQSQTGSEGTDATDDFIVEDTVDLSEEDVEEVDGEESCYGTSTIENRAHFDLANPIERLLNPQAGAGYDPSNARRYIEDMTAGLKISGMSGRSWFWWTQLSGEWSYLRGDPEDGCNVMDFEAEHSDREDDSNYPLNGRCDACGLIRELGHVVNAQTHSGKMETLAMGSECFKKVDIVHRLFLWFSANAMQAAEGRARVSNTRKQWVQLLDEFAAVVQSAGEYRYVR